MAITEAFETEIKGNDAVLEHFKKEINRVDEKYDLKKLNQTKNNTNMNSSVLSSNMMMTDQSMLDTTEHDITILEVKQ